MATLASIPRPTGQSGSYRRLPALDRLFATRPTEGSWGVEEVVGTLPPCLRGTLYLNGPGGFAQGTQPHRHWLDGDGLVSALRFEADAVHFTQRFVQTPKRIAEQSAGRPLYRTFGTAFDSDRLAYGVGLESPVNVSVHPWRGRLLALGEQSLPWELDPITLETLGRWDFGGRVSAISPFSGHPHTDPITGETFNFGVSFAPRRPTLDLYHFDATGDLADRWRLPLDHPTSLHDFALGPNHAVFYLSPYVLDLAQLRGDGATVLEALAWRPELGSQLLVVDRETGRSVAKIPIDLGYCLHLGEAFEEAGHLVVDVLEMDAPVYPEYGPLPNLFETIAPTRAVRFRLDVEQGQLVDRQAHALGLAADFPSLAPGANQPNDRVWMLGIGATGQPGRKFFDQLLCFDRCSGRIHDRYQAPGGQVLGSEPVVVAGEHPANPVILCQRFDLDRGTAAFLLFAGHRLAEGPIATLPCPAPTLPCFHATWVSSSSALGPRSQADG